MADYPLLHSAIDLTGIGFIWGYTERVDYENQFYACFSLVTTHALLCGLPVDYWEPPLNLYGLVLTTVPGCVLCGENFYSLRLSARGLANLKEKPNSRGKPEFLSLLQAALEKTSFAFSPYQRTAKYLTAVLLGTSAEIKNVVRIDTLSRTLLIVRLPQGGYRLI